MANDKKTHLNLSKIVQIAKQDGVIFQNLEEPLLEGMINIKAIWPDLNGILSIVGTSLATLTFFVLYMVIFLNKIIGYIRTTII